MTSLSVFVLKQIYVSTVTSLPGRLLTPEVTRPAPSPVPSCPVPAPDKGRSAWKLNQDFPVQEEDKEGPPNCGRTPGSTARERVLLGAHVPRGRVGPQCVTKACHSITRGRAWEECPIRCDGAVPGEQSGAHGRGPENCPIRGSRGGSRETVHSGARAVAMPEALSNQNGGARSISQSRARWKRVPGAPSSQSTLPARERVVLGQSWRSCAPAPRGPRCVVPVPLTCAGRGKDARESREPVGDGESAGPGPETGRGFYEPSGTGWKRSRGGVPASCPVPACGTGVSGLSG